MTFSSRVLIISGTMNSGRLSSRALEYSLYTTPGLSLKIQKYTNTQIQKYKNQINILS
jgi:hypothetical protein